MTTRMESKPRSKKWQRIGLPKGNAFIVILALTLWGSLWLYMVHTEKQEIMEVTNVTLAEHLNLPIEDIPRPIDINRDDNIPFKQRGILHTKEVKVYYVLYRYKGKEYNVQYRHEKDEKGTYEESFAKMMER